MARNPIESEFRISKMADQSEMARNFQKNLSCVSMWNEIESDFRTSKMPTGSHFVKKIKKSVLI